MNKLFRKIGKFAPIFKDTKPKRPLKKTPMDCNFRLRHLINDLYFAVLRSRFLEEVKKKREQSISLEEEKEREAREEKIRAEAEAKKKAQEEARRKAEEEEARSDH